MRFIPETKIAKFAFEPHELLFLDKWYGLTHDRSLDSYRVRCLNARIALRELCEEVEIGRLDEPEFNGICQEVLSLLESDPIVFKCFQRGLTVLLPCLKQPPSISRSSQTKEKDKSENQTPLRNLRFAAADLASALDDRYFATACNRLRDAMEQKQCEQIVALTDAILSDLVAQGWTLRELFKWHHKFLADDGRTFGENLAFMLQQLKRSPEEFKVTLRISGGKRVQEIASLGGFALSTHSDVSSEKEHEKRFATEDEYTTFAVGTFRSVDFMSAAILARDEIEPLIDALRFEFEPGLLEIDKRCYVVRGGDSRAMLVTITNPVPNPIEPRDQEDFDTFSQKLSTVLTSLVIEPESRNRIETALRRYRFGRDSHNYSDKFLNWWMGLEALAAVGGLKIGRKVTENVSHAMLTGYVFRLLRDYVVTLQFLNPEWKEGFKNVSGAETIADLDVPRLIKLLQDDTQSADLWTTIQNRPLIVTRGKCIAEWVKEPAKLAEQIASHHQRLEWHIDRLYRIRCCLVHGSPVRFRLALYAANLEYYLKQTLLFVLDALSEHNHVASLPDLFQRGVLMWERQLQALKDQGANTSTITDAIFASVVAKD